MAGRGPTTITVTSGVPGLNYPLFLAVGLAGGEQGEPGKMFFKGCDGMKPLADLYCRSSPFCDIGPKSLLSIIARSEGAYFEAALPGEEAVITKAFDLARETT